MIQMNLEGIPDVYKRQGFYDMPGREQYNVQNRWLYKGKHYIFHGGLGALKEIRTSGQDEEHVHSDDIYRIKLHTNRYEGYMKHAFILNHEHGTNIAFMSSASMHPVSYTHLKPLW